MIAPTQLNKPSNWQDFEKLCKLLWGEMWCCENTIKHTGPKNLALACAYKWHS